MFSYDDLEDRKRAGVIRDFADLAMRADLLDPDDQVRRDIYVTQTAFAELEGLPDRGRAALKAEMVSFLTGQIVYWGDFRTGNFLKPLNPKGRWAEFKVRGAPQVRLYGAFVQQDTFIGVTACLRQNPPAEEDIQRRWDETWGGDVQRLDFQDPSVVLTNYRTIR